MASRFASREVLQMSAWLPKIFSSPPGGTMRVPGPTTSATPSATSVAGFLEEQCEALRPELARWGLPGAVELPGSAPRSRRSATQQQSSITTSRERARGLVAPVPEESHPTDSPVGGFGRMRLNALLSAVRQLVQDYDDLQRHRPDPADKAFLRTMAGAERALESIEKACEGIDTFRGLQRHEEVKVLLLNEVNGDLSGSQTGP